jgi:hypothetical protein
LVDAAGIPLACTVTGDDRNDVTQLISLVERVRPMRSKSHVRAKPRPKID